MNTESPARRIEKRMPLRRGILLALSLGLLLAGCDFGRPAATPEPFAPPTYEPGFAPAEAEGDNAESSNTTPDQAEPSEDNSDVEQPAGSDATPSRNTSSDILLPRTTGNGALYTGEIEADDEVPIISEVSGQVLELPIEVGDRVEKGDMLMRVDSTTLEAQRAQALAALEAAQANVDLLLVEADEADIEAARAAVAAADAAYQRALEGPTVEDRTVAEANLRQAEAAVERAQAAYDQVSWNPLIAALPESLQLEQASLALEAAQAQYDKIVKGATADVIASAYAQLASARANLRRLEDGPEAAQIRAAEAQVRQAETALYLAQLQLDKAVIRAPIGGIVARVNTAVGTMTTPGTTVVRLLSPEVKITVRVEESRIGDIQLGQPAMIRASAFPDRVFEGQISLIAPELDPATRTLRVTVRPTESAEGLTPGMYATVELLAE